MTRLISTLKFKPVFMSASLKVEPSAFFIQSALTIQKTAIGTAYIIAMESAEFFG